ncbi:hypothetical protein DXG03_005867 [Asterophora parasitica]|uniref:Uncharacterized protein n=1 Tax=Asterophora parasitica TaxID=117018 RepID=A0A9P7G5G2_9AGAR|nr:hypothetical protein DXG03_005867 [Asterophora parasitica]
MASRLAGEDIPDSPDLSLESDIVDQLCSVDIEFHFDQDNDHEIPSRPNSRLGFNRDNSDDIDSDSPLSDEDSLDEVDSEPLVEAGVAGPAPPQHQEWPSLADDVDITTLRCSISHASSLQSVEGWEASNDDCDEDIDAELDSDGSDSDDESDTISLFPTTDSLLSASFPSPAEVDSDWSLRPKYSCLPSPFSPRYIPRGAFTFRHTPQRHRYLHHGHSRHALHHIKWFWATREDRWIEHKARLCEAKAYSGLSIFSSISPGLYNSPPLDDIDTPSSPPSPKLPPLSIHPRRGDLSALRDPYCMHIDRYFVGMPAWTMAKTLWMFDVHMASMDGSEDDLFEEDRSESESIETSGSHASDDSDSTLVEADLSEGEITRADVSFDDERSRLPYDDSKGYLAEAEGESTSSALNKANLCASPSSDSLLSSSSKPQGLGLTPRARWATCWYRRWEVLLQLCMENNPAIVADRGVPSPAQPVKSQRFFIGDDWSIDDDDDDESGLPTGNVLVVVNHDDALDAPPSPS